MHSWADRGVDCRLIRKLNKHRIPGTIGPLHQQRLDHLLRVEQSRKVPIVVAAVHRAALEAEEACMVGRAERALMPSWMDVPGWPDAAFEADAAAADDPQRLESKVLPHFTVPQILLQHRTCVCWSQKVPTPWAVQKD